MKFVKVNASLILLSLILIGCSPDKITSRDDSKDYNIAFTLENTMLEVKPWKPDNSHTTTVRGAITVDGKPVQGVTIQSKHRTIETNKNGAFSILINQSTPSRILVQIKATENATIAGKKIRKEIQNRLLSQHRDIQVYYPVKINKVETSAQDSKNVTIRGQATVPNNDGSTFPTLVFEKYAMYGIVNDHTGKPVKDAVVNIRYDGVEGFSKSLPTNAKGEYSLYFMSEDEYKWLYVHVGDKHYELPNKKVFLIPEGTSIEANITLPETGTTIQDYIPFLRMNTASGELYSGTIIGLNVGNNDEYQVTIPNVDGSFSMAVPKKVWDRNPYFYQAKMSYFSKKPLKSGDWLSSSLLAKPQSHEPNRVPATAQK